MIVIFKVIIMFPGVWWSVATCHTRVDITRPPTGPDLGCGRPLHAGSWACHWHQQLTVGFSRVKDWILESQKISQFLILASHYCEGLLIRHAQLLVLTMCSPKTIFCLPTWGPPWKLDRNLLTYHYSVLHCKRLGLTTLHSSHFILHSYPGFKLQLRASWTHSDTTNGTKKNRSHLTYRMTFVF